MWLGMLFSNSNTFSLSHNCWLNEYNFSTSRLRWSAEAALRRARSDNWLATTAVSRNANSATQFCGSAMTNLNSGGKKK